MKREPKLCILFLTLPCFLAVIFAVIYAWGIWPSFQLITVNILCVALIALELAQAFTEKINTWKVCGFFGSGAISGIATALNVRNDIQSEAFTLEQLSFWGWLLIGLLAASVIALVVILIRMFRWNQDQWEEIRKWQQEYRKERMEARRQLRRSKQEYKQELSKEKATARIGKQKDRANKDIIVRDQKHERRMEHLNDWKKHWERHGRKSCVSDIRQSQGWRCEYSANLGLKPFLTTHLGGRGGMRTACGVNAALTAEIH